MLKGRTAIQLHTHMCVCVYIYIYIYIYIHTYIHIYIHTHTHTHTHLCYAEIRVCNLLKVLAIYKLLTINLISKDKFQ